MLLTINDICPKQNLPERIKGIKSSGIQNGSPDIEQKTRSSSGKEQNMLISRLDWVGEFYEISNLVEFNVEISLFKYLSLIGAGIGPFGKLVLPICRGYSCHILGAHQQSKTVVLTGQTTKQIRNN